MKQRIEEMIRFPLCGSCAGLTEALTYQRSAFQLKIQVALWKIFWNVCNEATTDKILML